MHERNYGNLILTQYSLESVLDNWCFIEVYGSIPKPFLFCQLWAIGLFLYVSTPNRHFNDGNTNRLPPARVKPTLDAKQNLVRWEVQPDGICKRVVSIAIINEQTGLNAGEHWLQTLFLHLSYLADQLESTNSGVNQISSHLIFILPDCLWLDVFQSWT